MKTIASKPIVSKRGALAAVVASLAASLLGCATSPGQCDPKNVDFFKNTSCLASGAYSERQRSLQSTLASEQSQNAAFRAVLTELETEQAAVKGKLRGRQAEYARLDAAWGNLKRSLHGELARNRALAARVEEIDGGVRGRKGADAAQQRATREQLQRQIVLLEQELNAGVYE